MHCRATLVSKNCSAAGAASGCGRSLFTAVCAGGVDCSPPLPRSCSRACRFSTSQQQQLAASTHPPSGMRAGLAAQLLGCMLLGSCISLAAASASPAVAAPLFAWATRSYISSAADGAHSKTSVNLLDDPAGTLQRLVASALDPGSSISEWLDADALAAEVPELVLVVLGSQVTTSDLRASSKQRLLAPLKELLSGAQSSLALPFMMHQASSAGNAQLLEFAGSMDEAVVVGCGAGASEASSLDDALAQLSDAPGSSSRPAVLVVCTQVPSEVSGTPAGMAAELQQLQDVHQAAAALNRRQLSVFAVRPDAGRADARRLQALGADVGVCGELCQTQVKWLQGILAAFILVFATFAGMGCLYMLDTPTRFDKPREGSRNE